MDETQANTERLTQQEIAQALLGDNYAAYVVVAFKYPCCGQCISLGGGAPNPVIDVANIEGAARAFCRGLADVIGQHTCGNTVEGYTSTMTVDTREEGTAKVTLDEPLRRVDDPKKRH